MAITFYEGLPRSGKSYTCVSRDIANALRNGRPVEAYVEGLNHEKIAPLVGLEVDRCKELLVYLPRDQVLRIPYVTRDNALIVIDELQNFFPNQRKPLGEDWRQFVAEHGHRGLDIVCMGQSFSECHKAWRTRTKTKVIYNKLDAIGMENKFNAQAYTATAPEKFVLVSDEVDAYDSQWFGTYKSHTGANIQTTNYKDKRASILNANLVRYGVPLSIAALVFGGWTLYRFFSGDAVKGTKVEAKADPARPGRQPAAAQPSKVAPAAPPPTNFIDALNAQYRPRFAAWTGPHGGRAVDGVIEWWDGNGVRERLTFAQIKQLGGFVRASNGIAVVQSVKVTSWPVSTGPGPAPMVAIPGIGK